MFDGSDTVVLYDELAYQDVLPVLWRVLPGAIDQALAAGYAERNVRVLQACAAVEEHAGSEKPDEVSPELLRLDFKLNLVLQLLGKLVSRERMPAAASINFNAHGASWTVIGPAPESGEQGVLRIYLHESLPQPLELLATISAVEGALVRAHFESMPDGVGELIQRLAFLCHRRDVADARKSRSSAA